MKRANNVCFDCRITSREGWLCRQCRQPMKNMGDRWRVPPAHDDKGWAEYEAHRDELEKYQQWSQSWPCTPVVTWWQHNYAKKLLEKWGAK